MDKAESFAVIGIGQFGASLCEALVEADQEVLAIDINEDVINDIAGSVMRAVIADAQDEETMRDLAIGSFDHVYISIGKDIEASIMATLIVKDLGAKDVICRAENHNHARVLERVGADLVVRPEHDLAKRLIFSKLNPSVIDYVHINKNTTVAEVDVKNPAFFNKTLLELDFRNRYQVNVIAVVTVDDQVNTMPTGQDRIHQGDKITVLGEMKEIQKLNEIIGEG
ncbi:MAG: TrkA family potassium uptake protein [Limosilactobacillus gorillae]|uniref:potassium channel family protein n=1 Tax=Limosilactobacillus gorillae TaxID=1450649 RepID=UPI000B291DB5|nr:TrkA family potassium uptake protein [Limosilactobacillus gorillae]MDO4855517.1 TrkA family potassium uptake protein [Limosilactobacillus gorillae]